MSSIVLKSLLTRYFQRNQPGGIFSTIGQLGEWRPPNDVGMKITDVHPNVGLYLAAAYTSYRFVTEGL